MQYVSMAFEELGRFDAEALTTRHQFAEQRYAWYRKRGLSVKDAHQATKAWARNVTQQAVRRKQGNQF